MDRLWFSFGAICCFVAVAAGAFGAHALKSKLTPGDLVIFETGVRYQFYHGLALLAVAWAVTRWPSHFGHWAGGLFLFGILVFSGSLYVLTLTGIRWLGAITPIGGLSLLLGWIFLLIAPWR